MRLKVEFELMGIKLCDLGGFADQAVEAVALLVDYGKQICALRLAQLRLVRLRLVPLHVGKQCFRRSFDGCERSAELMSHRVQQHRTQAVTLSRRLGARK